MRRRPARNSRKCTVMRRAAACFVLQFYNSIALRAIQERYKVIEKARQKFRQIKTLVKFNNKSRSFA